MLKLIAIVVAMLLVGLLAFAATRPDSFRVARTATVAAPAGAIFPLIQDFHRWGEWSPWERLDPEMIRAHSGPASGVGAVYEWEGNRKAGQGRMEIIDATAPSSLSIQLDFIKPFASRNLVEFTLEERDGATDVTWAMSGPNSYLGKLMSVFYSFEDLIGDDYERGLAALKQIAEREAAEEVSPAADD